MDVNTSEKLSKPGTYKAQEPDDMLNCKSNFIVRLAELKSAFRKEYLPTLSIDLL